MVQTKNRSWRGSVCHTLRTRPLRKKSICQSVNQSINQSTNQPINHQLFNQSINQLFNQSTNQSINQSFNQSIKQSTNQPITYIVVIKTCILVYMHLYKGLDVMTFFFFFKNIKPGFVHFLRPKIQGFFKDFQGPFWEISSCSLLCCWSACWRTKKSLILAVFSLPWSL